MDFNRIQHKKETKGSSSKRDSSYNDRRTAETLHYWDRMSFRNVNDRHGFYSEDLAEISPGSEIIQCARRDWKKEKWKQGRGKLNWKHGRKNGFDMKHQVFEEDTDVEEVEEETHVEEEDTDVEEVEEEVELRPIVSDKLRAINFDETHYLSFSGLLLSFYIDTDFSNDEGLRNYILTNWHDEFVDIVINNIRGHSNDISENFPEIKKCNTETKTRNKIKNLLRDREDFRRYVMTQYSDSFFDKVYNIIEINFNDILERLPEIKERISETGNCGEIANFLFEGNTSTHEDDFHKFMQELREEVPEDKVKLIKVQANIGHAFTLICYNQNDKTVTELIQAWQGEYSVKKSLDGANVKNIYLNSELADMFNTMHNDMKNETGRQLYDQVFLGAGLKEEIGNFEITQLDVKILDEQPEQYAERIASKEL